MGEKLFFIKGKTCLVGGGCLGRYFSHKRDKATDDWRKLHNEELHDCAP